jgi:hypothetical protein
MADGVRVEGTDQLEEIAHALKEASDKDLTNNVRRSMREVAKPVGQAVMREGAVVMPKLGGFSARVEQGKVGISSAIASKQVHVTIALSNKGVDMKSLDAGTLRHPVFKRADRPVIWRSQAVPARAFTTALKAQAPVVRRAVLEAMQTTLDNASRKVH